MDVKKRGPDLRSFGSLEVQPHVSLLEEAGEQLVSLDAQQAARVRLDPHRAV